MNELDRAYTVGKKKAKKGEPDDDTNEKQRPHLILMQDFSKYNLNVRYSGSRAIDYDTQ